MSVFWRQRSGVPEQPIGDLEARMEDAFENETTPAIAVACRIQDGLMQSLVVQIVLCILYVAVFVVAVSGNLLVVYVVVRNKTMQTVTNIFITNLALSDLIVNFTSLWLTPTYTFVGQWIWGELLCHGLPLFQGMSIFISTLTLMAIAVDRYLVIVRHSPTLNLGDHMSMTKCLIIIVFIWIVSLGLVLPYALHMRVLHISRCGFDICSEDWSNTEFRSVYGTVVMVLQFVLPFTIIGISYRRIWTFLANRRWASERSIETKRRKRLLSMLIIMVVVFAFCWFPFNTLNILRDLKMDGIFRAHFTFFFLIVHLISMTATCWNPLVYAWMNESFREEFVRAIPLLRSKFKSVSRVKMISECQPAMQRKSCADAPSCVSRVARHSLPSKPYETLLLTTEQPCVSSTSETTLL